MAIIRVGLDKDFQSIPSAIKAANPAGGDAVLVDAGLKLVDQLVVIDRPLWLGGNRSDWNNLTSLTVKLHPSISKVNKTNLLSLGVTQIQIDSTLAALPYKYPQASFILPDGSIDQLPVGWYSNILTKGIITTKEGVTDVHIEGFELFDARTYDLTGSAVRTQSINNSVQFCKIHDNQAGVLCNHQMIQDPNGLWKIVDGNAVNVNMVGYNLVTDNWFWNNGCMESGGLDHDIYAPDCAVSVHARNKEWNCIGGHHEKIHGAVFQISLGQNAIDTDTGLTSQTLDADSGLIYYINGHARKVDPVNSISNTGEMVFARNNRDNSPFGNFFMMRGSRLESTVHRPGSFAKVLNSPTYKDDPTGLLGVPSPFTFDIRNNVCTSTDYTKLNAKGQIVDDITDYLLKPFNVPALGGVVINNYVGKIGAPTPDVVPVDFGRELFTDASNIITDLKTFLDVLGQTDKQNAFNYCQQHITSTENPMAIAELQAELVAEQAIVTQLQTQLTQTQTNLQVYSNEVDALNAQSAALQAKIDAAKAALA